MKSTDILTNSTDISTNSTDIFILSARVRRPLVLININVPNRPATTGQLILILRYLIISTRTLCTLSVAWNDTDFCTDKVQNSSEKSLLSAGSVQRPTSYFIAGCPFLFCNN